MTAFSPNAQTIFADPGPPTWSQVRTWGTQVEQALSAAGALTITNNDYTLLSSDQEEVITYAGSTFHTLTVGAPSGYNSLHNNIIVNLSSRGWKQLISGYVGGNTDGSFILWPGQSYQLARQGGAWQVLFKPVRAKLASNITLFVAPSGGSFNNDGLGSDAPFDSMFSAIVNVAGNQFDFPFGASQALTVQLMDGTHTSGLHLPSFLGTTAGNFALTIQGNSGNPNAVTIADPANPAIQIFNRASCLLQNMIISGLSGISATNYALLWLGPGLTFASVTVGAHISLTESSRCIPQNNYSITGGAPFHLQCGAYGDYTPDAGITITCSPGISFSQDFIFLTNFSNGNFGPVAFSGAGSVLGTRYLVEAKSLLTTPLSSGHGTDFPGSVAGGVDASSALL